MVWPAPEVFCALLTGEELGEKVDELPHLLLLGRRRMVGVICCHSVQEGPGVAPQLLPVQWTLWVLLWLWLGSLGLLKSHTDVGVQRQAAGNSNNLFSPLGLLYQITVRIILKVLDQMRTHVSALWLQRPPGTTAWNPPVNKAFLIKL